MSFFDEVETTVANTRYLQAVEDDGPIRLNLTPFAALSEHAEQLRGHLTVGRLLKLDTLGYYFFKRFLLTKGLEDVVELLDLVDTYRKAFRHMRAVTALKVLEDIEVWKTRVEPPKHTIDVDGSDGEEEKDGEGSTATEGRVDAAGGKPAQEASGEAGEGGEAAEADAGADAAAAGAEEKPKERLYTGQEMIVAGDEELQTVRQILKDHVPVNEKTGQKQHPSSALFNNFLGVVAHLLGPLRAQFFAHELFEKLVQHEDYAKKPVSFDSFRVFRVLGRGAFGAVSAVQKIDTHAIFAMKEMGKKQVKENKSEWMCISEKKVLSKMRSPFVLGLTYAFHNQDNLYLIFDMCSGGDLRFHLKQLKNRDHCFPVERARFYAAEVLLGLDHIHSFNIVYRDLKPNNILLDNKGHAKISDLGLTVRLRKEKVLKHLAGTAGYWAPEIVQKSGTYKASDWWSFGVFLYEMLSGRRPRCNCTAKTMEWCPFSQKNSDRMESNAQSGEGILKVQVEYPRDRFSDEAEDLLQKLFEVDHTKRLGANGAEEIMQHPFFESIDWDLLEALKVDPPFVPDNRTVHANTIGEVGEFNKGKYRKIKITEEDEKHYEDFAYSSAEAVQTELITALEKQELQPEGVYRDDNNNGNSAGCCVIA